MEKVNVSPSDGFSQVYDSMNDKFVQNANPIVLVMLSVIIIFYFIVFSYLGYSVTPAPQTTGMKFIEIVMWGLLIFLVLINGIQYFFQIDVETAIKNLFKPVPEVDLKIKPEKQYIEKKGKGLVDELEKDLGLGNLKGGGGGGKQVFNVPGNNYTYHDAKALCKAYGAKLATYSQIENAYKSGAEWCNYGWSEDQLALYPTQISTWKKLKKIKGHEHDCGRPGVNGGFIKNKRVRFGVNCYGNKPNATPEEKKLMKVATPYPLTPKDMRMNKLIKKYKNNLDNILVSPFNYKKWFQL